MSSTISGSNDALSVEPLPTIHMFWFGAPLTRLEQMCMASFVAHGHRVDLCVYDELEGVPPGVNVRDAASILARQLLFRHRRSGSVGLFADWFRYKLLYEHGGVWADTDVACLRPFTYPFAEIYAWQSDTQICNAVLGLPRGHRLAAWLAECCEHPNRILPYDDWRKRFAKWRRRYLQGDKRDNIRWGEYGPRGLTEAINYFGDTHKALPASHFYPVACDDWYALFESATPATLAAISQSTAVHFWNNMMRQRAGFEKTAKFPADSVFEQLYRRYTSNA